MLHLPSLWHQNSFLMFAMKLLPERCLYWICNLNDFLIAIGIFVALALRFDVSRGKPNRYFNSAFAGYTAGLVLTIFVMNWFQAAQVNLMMPLYSLPSHSNSISTFELTFFLRNSLFSTCTACTSLYSAWCYRFCGCSLFMEWRSKGGKGKQWCFHFLKEWNYNFLYTESCFTHSMLIGAGCVFIEKMNSMSGRTIYHWCYKLKTTSICIAWFGWIKTNSKHFTLPAVAGVWRVEECHWFK